MLSLQLVAFLCYVGGTWVTSLRALWAATGMRARLRLPPSPGDKFADTVLQVGLWADWLAWLWAVGGTGLWARPLAMYVHGQEPSPKSGALFCTLLLRPNKRAINRHACRSWGATPTSWLASLATGGWCGRWGWACTTAPFGAAKQVRCAGRAVREGMDGRARAVCARHRAAL